AKRNALIKEETIKTTESPAPTEKSAEQIKAEAITAADIQSQHGDNLGAVVTIRMAIEKVGEDAELNELAAAYEKAYQEQLTQQVPETEQETAAPETTEAAAVYANDVLTAYDSDLAWTYSEAKNPEGGSFQMAGKKYKNGVVFHRYCFSSSITYNVDGDYSKMSFYLGHQDNTDMDPVELKVYLDNKFYESFSMAASDVPQMIEIDVRGKQTIRFVADKGNGSGYCLADLKIE
ncbi:MAG: NPCBM/NEW2 domain-containing protein, partial [Oscillospiraceae bacterium]|nr:NPCBM/NEW2 domain-containing protein [Oscillospiraceae bacterium]